MLVYVHMFLKHRSGSKQWLDAFMLFCVCLKADQALVAIQLEKQVWKFYLGAQDFWVSSLVQYIITVKTFNLTGTPS